MAPILLTLISVACVSVWIKMYAAAGKARKYSENRQGFEHKRRFELFSKIVFVLANALLVFSFWSEAPWLFK